MMIVYPNLAKLMMERKISIAELAEKIGLSLYQLHDRLIGSTDFTLSEVVKICQFFDYLNDSELFIRLDTKI